MFYTNIKTFYSYHCRNVIKKKKIVFNLYVKSVIFVPIET